MEFKGVLLAFGALIILAGLEARAEKQEEPIGKYWVVNGAVSTFAAVADTLYLGGSFSYIGPYSGSLTAIGRKPGDVPRALPEPNGPVHAIVSDGSGGWFVAGAFTRVAEQPRTNLVHIKADSSVDSVVFPAPEGSVKTIGFHRGQLLVAGSFVLRDGEISVSNFAILDPASGRVSDWDTALGPIEAMAVYRNLVYLGGGQSITVADVERRTTRQLQIEFRRSFGGGGVVAMSVFEGTLYVGGRFDRINAEPHGSVAAVDLITETLKTWDPLRVDSTGYVGAIASTADSVFLGGRDWVHAYDPVSAERKQWEVQLSGSWEVQPSGGLVSTLVMDGSSVLIGGGFTAINDHPRLGLGAVDAGTGAVKPWFSHANSTVKAIALWADSIRDRRTVHECRRGTAH